MNLDTQLTSSEVNQVSSTMQKLYLSENTLVVHGSGNLSEISGKIDNLIVTGDFQISGKVDLVVKNLITFGNLQVGKDVTLKADNMANFGFIKTEGHFSFNGEGDFYNFGGLRIKRSAKIVTQENIYFGISEDPEKQQAVAVRLLSSFKKSGLDILALEQQGIEGFKSLLQLEDKKD